VLIIIFIVRAAVHARRHAVLLWDRRHLGSVVKIRLLYYLGKVYILLEVLSIFFSHLIKIVIVRLK